MPSYEMNEDNRSAALVPLSKEEIQKLDGQYDGDKFFILTDSSFYDPLGYFFDKEGFDGVGGTYGEDGYYIHPQSHEAAYGDDIEDYTLDDEDDEV